MKPNRLALFTVATGITFSIINAHAGVLFEDGFNYTTGDSLGGQGGWAGSTSTSIGVTSGNLSYSGLQNLGGNQLTILQGGNSSMTNNFVSSPVTSGSIYFSLLVDCTTLPTANEYLFALDSLNSKPSGSSDPLALYTGANGSGWKIGVRDGGSGATYESTVLNLNQTYLIVGEYTFGATATLNLYLDPTLGGSQPGTADATTTGTSAANIADAGFKSQSVTTQGDFDLDNLIIGTTWADVTPTDTPEPGSPALLGLGMLASTWLLRRKARA